jgi:hypothetical protein
LSALLSQRSTSWFIRRSIIIYSFLFIYHSIVTSFWKIDWHHCWFCEHFYLPLSTLSIYCLKDAQCNKDKKEKKQSILMWSWNGHGERFNPNKQIIQIKLQKSKKLIFFLGKCFLFEQIPSLYTFACCINANFHVIGREMD